MSAAGSDSLGSVDHQIHHHLLELAGVGKDEGQVVAKLQPKLDVFRNRRLDQPADFIDEA